MSAWPAGVARIIGALPLSVGTPRLDARSMGTALAIAFQGAENSPAEDLHARYHCVLFTALFKVAGTSMRPGSCLPLPYPRCIPTEFPT